MNTPDVDPLIGKVLAGRFRIVSLVGSGGMGLVYKAIQEPLNRPVALKVLNPNYDSENDPEFEKRFLLEASVTSKLKHPNTVVVHDYGRTDDGLLYLAMEFLEGETLHMLLAREKRLPWARALGIASQVARSVREAHKHNLVHRDLKPANIMLLSESTGGDVVKVLDFGLVKVLPRGGPADSAEEITKGGVMMGSPMYIAPEQARREFDARTDIYTLGVLLFQMMTGRPPFEGTDGLEVIVKHLKENPPELRSLALDVPTAVETLVMRCLQKEPQARFQTMSEVVEAIKEILMETSASGSFIDPRQTAPSQPTVKRVEAPKALNRNLVVGVVAGLIALALLIWAASAYR